MVIQPLRDKVLLRPDPKEEQTAGGILLPDSKKKKPLFGTVVAIGTGTTLDNGTFLPMEVEVGQRVLYSEHAGQVLKTDGEELLILSVHEILAVLE